MYKRFFAFSVLVATLLLGGPSQTFAGGWVAEQVTTATYLGLDCVNSYCIAVGASGAVAYSADGQTWQSGTSGVSTDLFNVTMVSSTVGYAVGTGGVILKTANTGATWTAETSGTTEQLYGISAGSTSTIYAAGEDAAIRKSTDSGATWASANGSSSSIDARAIEAVSATTAWVVGKTGYVYKTTNGGTTWTAQTSGTTEKITAIDMYSSSRGWMGGENRFAAKTTDGGTTWSAITISVFDAAETVSDLEFTSTSIGIAVGSLGTIATTTDGGTTWTEETNTSTALYGVANSAIGSRFVAGTNGYIGILDNYGPDAPTNFIMTSGDGAVTNDTTPAFSWTAAVDAESSVASYEFSSDDVTWTGIGAVTSYSVATALSAGSQTLYVRAVDEAGNTGDSASVTITIDRTNPTVGSATPLTAIAGTATQMLVAATDASGIASCTLYVNSASAGAMTLDAVSGSYYKSYTFSAAGTYSAYANCSDDAGNSASGASASVVVSASSSSSSSSSDTTAPSVSLISPTAVVEMVTRSFTAAVYDAVGISSCSFYRNGALAGSMTVSGGYASYSYMPTQVGTFIAYAKCTDAAGNIGTGGTVVVTVSPASASEEETSAVGEAEAGDLIKMACSGGEDVNDPCRAVYYNGADGKRHAFPNEKVYFTWYENFDDIVIVTDDYMASLTLGHNVTYHPGVTMVKFPSLNTVYAVGEEGELRAVASEEVAISIFGSTWNKQIDDISEAFYGNYSFGEKIDSTSDFDPSEVEASVSVIDEIL